MVLLKKGSVVVRQAHHPELVEGRLRIVYRKVVIVYRVSAKGKSAYGGKTEGETNIEKPIRSRLVVSLSN
jgi:hypothetical protein